MKVLELKNISKSFKDKRVLNNISLEVEEGDFFGLIGPNGAGKSTLIQLICGLLEPDSGSISVFNMGYDKNTIDIKKNYGLVPQELAIFENLNAKDNLEYFGRMYGLKGAKLTERIKDVMEIMGLDYKDKKKVKDFSGGMKRRLNLGCSILHQPKFLILDEPTVGIDAQSRNKIFDFLRELNQDGVTIIYTSHYMEEVESLCNQIFIMDLGKEVSYGEKSELKSMYGGELKIKLELNKIRDSLEDDIVKLKGVNSCRLEGTRLTIAGNKDLLCLKDLFGLIECEDVYIKNISVDESKLEEIFLDITGKKLRD